MTLSPAPPDPLHIQVALALGYTDIQQTEDIWWGRALDAHMNPIPQFDRDWAATGPIIKELKISIVWGKFTPEMDYEWGASRRTGWVTNAMDPLVAVCFLILNLAKAGELKPDLLKELHNAIHP